MIDELGAVILCYGSDALARAAPLVSALRHEGVSAPCITVVHNPSGQASLESEIQGAAVVSPPRNLGYAGGMNLGIKHQIGLGRDLILLLTMDVSLHRGAISILREAIDRSPTYGVLGPVLAWRGKTGRRSWGVRWSRTGAIEHVLTSPIDDDHDGVVECDSIDGAVVLIRSDVVTTIGPLTDRLFMYFEETEFCLRAKRAGWKVGVVLGAAAEQEPGESRRPGAFSYLIARNGLEFARLVAGRRGIVAALGRNVARTWRLTKMRFSPRSDHKRRKFASASLAGLWRGIGAFFRNQWGPPPPDLAGIGDVTFAE